jgi:ADP-glucose pyrophosphorylase
MQLVILSIAMLGVSYITTILLNLKKNSKTNVTVINLNEFDPIYSYRNALLKILQIESELEATVISMDYYSTNRYTLFSPMETVYIKQELEQKLKQLISDYEQGTCSLFDFNSQLESILRQIDILTYKLAA